MIHIGAVVRNAHVFNFSKRLDGSMETDSLLKEVERLFDLLTQRRIDYLLVGGIALLQFVEGRNTEDIDLIIALSALADLPEIQITSQDDYFARGQLGNLQIDFLLTRNPLFSTVLRDHAAPQTYTDRMIPCATVEGLLLLKLYALPSLYRQGNFARVSLYENDIATLLFSYRTPLKPLFSRLAHHLSSADLDSVQEIVVEIEERIARFGRGLDQAS